MITSNLSFLHAPTLYEMVDVRQALIIKRIYDHSRSYATVKISYFRSVVHMLMFLLHCNRANEVHNGVLAEGIREC
jgi:hypothetical protein